MPVFKRWVDLMRRDDEFEYGDDDWSQRSWYWSDQARAIKWGFFFGLITLLFLALIGMYYHAERRMKKGMAPLSYHRWLVPRSRRAQFEQHPQQPEDNFSFYQQQHQDNGIYGMHAVPPPAYNPHYADPPMYSGGPPIGSTKVDPSQHPIYQSGEGSGSGPAPPPPAAAPIYTPQQRDR